MNIFDTIIKAVKPFIPEGRGGYPPHPAPEPPPRPRPDLECEQSAEIEGNSEVGSGQYLELWVQSK